MAETTSDSVQVPLWSPTAQQVAATRIDRLRRDLVDAIGIDLPDTEALYQFSLEHPGDFWDVVWDECGVEGDRGDGPAYVLPPAGADMRAGKFFPAALLNYTDTMLNGGDRVGAGDNALVFVREDGVRRELSWSQLRTDVAAMRSYLRSQGVKSGDRVAALMPNVPETVVVFLAAAGIGAVFTSTSPDFGTAGVLDRFSQVAPTVLLAADGYVYAGKRHDRIDRLAEVAAGLPSVRTVLLHGEFDREVTTAGLADRLVGKTVLTLDDALAVGSALLATDPSSGESQLLPFDHPLYILYSSGTTGVPKCIVHRAGGVLIKHLVEHQLHCDIRPGDRVFYFTTCGWMMWNWLVGALASGATVVLYDGSPLHPDNDVLWRLAEQEQVTLFGTSPKFLDACAKNGDKPGVEHDLSHLRTVCVTGSPLSPEGFEYVYRAVKSDVHLAVMSGGTDIVGCFTIGDPTRPVFAGEMQGAALGMAVDVWTTEGISLNDSPGVHGELVCTAAFPSMPLEFWGDEDGNRYTAAYFDRFEGVWTHGDFASWTTNGGIQIHGRSDATLNSAGVRIGTAEIYRQVDQIPEVAESLAIGQEWDNDTRIVLFVRLIDGITLDDSLRQQIVKVLRTNCSPRHVPSKIVQVSDIPRTRSGKLAELAVADVVHGRPVRNTEALANPESLDNFAGLAQLQQ